MIKAVIFDMDGLMVNTEPIQSKGFELLLREYGKKPIHHSNGLVHSVGKTGSCAELKIQYHINEDLDILKQKRQQYYQKVLRTEDIKPMPGLFQLLKLLKQNNFKIAVGTLSFLEDINVIFTKLKILSYFDVFVTCEDVENGKPAPDVYLKVAERLNFKPIEFIVLEDSESGVSAGKSAGMKVIAVPNKYTKDHDFSKADLIVSSLAEINLEVIDKLP